MAKRNDRIRKHRVDVRRRLCVEHLGDRRVFAAISGMVFEDVNGSLLQDNGESGAASRLVFLDTNSNNRLDGNEATALSALDGAFRFDGLADGNYSVRLFNGTLSQRQTFPIQPESSTSVVAVANPSGLSIGPDYFATSTDSSVIVSYPNVPSVSSVTIGSKIEAMQRLPGGDLLLVGSDASLLTSWTFDPLAGVSTPVAFTDSSGSPVTSTTGWGSLLLDAQGRGIVMPKVDNPATSPPIAVRAIDASDVDSGIKVSVTTTLVPADTQMLTSATGVRTVFAAPMAGGLDLSLWSNATGSLITPNPVEVMGANRLLSFDDESGLVALGNSGGGLSIHDVDANFAALYTVDAGSAVMIDAERDLLITYSAADSKLRLLSLADSTLLAEAIVDLSTIGDVTRLARGSSSDTVVALGSSGIQQIWIHLPASHQITIASGLDAAPVTFGVQVQGDNEAPRFDEMPTFEINEDESLLLGAPSAKSGSSDPDGDFYVVLQSSPASHGTATIGSDGLLSYVPEPDFYGADAVNVLLHDGRSLSNATLNFNVFSVPDDPTGLTIDLDPVPENIPVGTPIGQVSVTDVDGGGHVISIDDERFGVRGGDIIFLGGDINFEDQDTIPIVVSATDSETGGTVSRSGSVRITDANDPITGITPTEAFVFENSPGDVVTELKVLDEDAEQFHILTVDDSRFVVEGFDLRLADGVALDFETEPEIIVHVTATEVGAGGTFTQAITIAVRDLPEQPLAITLTDNSVVEFTAGDVVGDVKVDGAAPNPAFNVTVNDARFEVVDSTLKLRDDVFVERAIASEMQLTITVTDPSGQFATITQEFVIEVLLNETPLHNLNDPFDVNHSGSVTASDALAIINYLNIYGPGPVGSGSGGLCYDVNADGFITALDALLVLNRLNQIPSGTVGGEGEQLPLPKVGPKISPQFETQSIAADSDSDRDVPSDAPFRRPSLDAMFVNWQADSVLPDDSRSFADETGGENANDSSAGGDGSLTLLSDETV